MGSLWVFCPIGGPIIKKDVLKVILIRLEIRTAIIVAIFLFLYKSKLCRNMSLTAFVIYRIQFVLYSGPDNGMPNSENGSPIQ